MSEFLNNPFIILFLVIGLGMALGKVNLFGLSLGSSGVLFIALLFGHFGLKIPMGIGTFGLVLFVYAIGVGAGGRFFNAILRQGSQLAKLALCVVFLGTAVAWALAKLMDIPVDLAAGLFAGALTSTPALAAGTDFLGEAGSAISIGYGIAYPFGVMGVVIFVQVLPRFLKRDLQKEGEVVDREASAGEEIVHKLVKVTNSDLTGQIIAEESVTSQLSCQITRIMKSGRLVPLSYEDQFELGQEVIIVGRAKHIPLAIRLIGKVSETPFILDTERERRQLLMSSKEFSGKSLSEINLLRNHGVTISRITRLGFTFVPEPNTVLDSNDHLTVVGSARKIDAFAKVIGHRSQGFNETDLLSLGFGLAIGVILGTVSINLPSGEGFSLGMAGGPLLAGLLLGHFGRVGGIIGHIPRETRILLQELGLVLFLAEAGIKGGGQLVETLLQFGPLLFVFGLLVTSIPMIIAYFLASKVFKMNLLESLGGICGGMTSTPALGLITEKTGSQAPVVSYATAYPVALILMTLFAKFLIQLLS